MSASKPRPNKSPVAGSADAAARPWHPPRAIGLARALLKAGYGSRRQTEDLVTGGRVRVGDTVVTDPRQMVAAGADIFLDDELLCHLQRRYFAVHKPARIACGGEESAGRRSVSEYFPLGVVGLVPAGRMDSLTTGLLLVSNDPVWNNMITTTRGLEQDYRIQFEGELTDLELSLITAGVHLPGRGLFKPQAVRIVESMKGHTVVSMTVREGKVRQVRRMMATLRHKVTLVRRTRIGDIRLVDLSVGGYRELSAAEIASVRQINAAIKRQGG